jgi:hypothetical protein
MWRIVVMQVAIEASPGSLLRDRPEIPRGATAEAQKISFSMTATVPGSRASKTCSTSPGYEM